jgi:hypothetical protein
VSQCPPTVDAAISERPADVREEERLRTCTRCGEQRPIDLYYRSANGRDGRQSACKDCHRARVAAYRARLRERNARRTPPGGTKVCGSCRVVQEAASFHRNRSTTDGLHWVCKTCNRDPAERVPIERRRTIRTYGLTRDGSDRLYAAQDGRCAICIEPFEVTPHIDHDHESGEVRGLLCRGCNLALGYLKDDVDRLRSAVRYLERASAGSR